MIRVSSDDRGVILIALLWILTAISVIALSFSRESFVEMAAARNARDLSDSYYIARGGIAATAYQLMQKTFFPAVRQLELADTPPDPIEFGRVTGSCGDGVYEVDVQDESGKLDLNVLAEDRLRGLLEVLGITKRDADIIADSVMDWKDADNLHRINGAEDDYYQTLRPPYKAKNGRFDTVEELLLVRGVTRDYFYGFPEKTQDGAMVYRYGLSRFLTVFSNNNTRVNVNYAAPEVLMSIPGMPPQAAQAIYERRKTKPFKTVQEITQDIPITIPPSAMAQLSTERTGVYTLTSYAHRENSKVRRVIRAVIRLDPRETTRYKVLYWNENVPTL